jgi:cell wall assembly regulator SMI1
MKRIWDRIHVWLSDNAPDVLANLRPGATEEQIRAAEAEMGVSLPDDVKASYRIHDGQDLGVMGCGMGFLYGWELCSLARMLQGWKCHKELLDDGTFDAVESDPSDKVREDWWHPAWIPITDSSFGYCHCIDLVPKRAGRPGQIILWCHDDGNRPIKAESFEKWLDWFAFELEIEYWVNSEQHGGLVRAHGL